MGKKSKEHNKKVAKRNEQINLQRKKYQEFQKKIMTEFLAQQKQKEMINNSTSELAGIDAPTLTEQTGPTL